MATPEKLGRTKIKRYNQQRRLERTIYKKLGVGFRFCEPKHRLMLAEQIGRRDEPR